MRMTNCAGTIVQTAAQGRVLPSLPKVVGVLVVIGLVVGGYAFGRAGAARVSITMTPVPLPQGREAVSVAWLDAGLVAELQPLDGANALTGRLWLMPLDGSAAEPLPIPKHPGCDGQSFRRPARLPDGRLGYLVHCFPNRSALSVVHLMAYDQRAGRAEDLLSSPLKSTGPGRGDYAWDPTMRRGITDDGVGLKEQLFWFTRDGKQLLDIGMSRAYGVAWSPSGAQIALLGALPQGLSGPASADAVFNLYLMRPDGTGLRPLVEGIRYPGQTAWSPDGRWLVFAGQILAASKRPTGLWLGEVATGRYELITTGSFGHPAWSPENSRLAVVEWSDSMWGRPARLLVIEVGPIIHRLELSASLH